MSADDVLFCRRIHQITARKKLSSGSKVRIRTLVRTPGFTFHWKGLREKAAATAN